MLEDVINIAEKCKDDTVNQYYKEEVARRESSSQATTEKISRSNQSIAQPSPVSTSSTKNITDKITESTSDKNVTGESQKFTAEKKAPLISKEPSSPMYKNSSSDQTRTAIFQTLCNDLDLPERNATDAVGSTTSSFQASSRDSPMSNPETQRRYQSMRQELMKPQNYKSPSGSSQEVNQMDLSRVTLSRPRSKSSPPMNANHPIGISHSEISTSLPLPSFNRELKPSKPITPMKNMTESPSQFDFSQNQLTPVLVPHNVRELFQKCSVVNTLQNIETCGVLAGKLLDDGFYLITHLLIPEQRGTADSCVMLGETELMHIQDSLDILTIGWIHTHPSQTAFLSSVDLHTHFGYQCLLSEAVAYVISHKFDEFGIFNLTERGLSEMTTCSARGHHLHQDISTLFQCAEHATITTKYAADIIDLRNFE